MASSILSAARERTLHSILAYDQETGIFTWAAKISRRIAPGDLAGHKSKEYVYIRIDGAKFMAHRLAWFYVHGVWPTGEIDHINGDKSDNRLTNLRDVSTTINQQNQRGARKDNKLGFMGVSLSSAGSRYANKPYRAEIRYGGKQHLIGRFATPEQAHQAYLEAKRKHHPGNTI